MPLRDPEARRAYEAAYYEANRKKLLAYQAAYHDANREKVLARQAVYREANREELSTYQAAYCEGNRDYITGRRRRRAREVQAGTVGRAVNGGQPWSGAEDAVLMSMNLAGAAIHLGRTYYACKARREVLRGVAK